MRLVMVLMGQEMGLVDRGMVPRGMMARWYVARKRRGEKQERSTSPGKLRMILDRLIRVKIHSMEMGKIKSSLFKYTMKLSAICIFFSV